MKTNWILVANCVAIVSSIFGYIIVLLHTWRGQPTTPRERQRQVYGFIVVSVLFTFLLMFLSFKLKYDIDTIEQTGSFRQYAQGIQDVYYAILYKNPPNLEFKLLVPSNYSTHGPEILEQRADGFKVKIGLDSWRYDWKATGMKGP